MKKKSFQIIALVALLLLGGGVLPKAQAINVTGFEVYQVDGASGPCSFAVFYWQIYASGANNDVPISYWYEDLAGVVITDGNGALLHADDLYRAAGYPGGGSGAAFLGSDITARPITVRVYETTGYTPYGYNTPETRDFFASYDLVWSYSFDPKDFVADCASLPMVGGDDTDNDGFPDAADNCPAVANSDQADSDGDGMGDTCDEDDDGDGVLDTADNCPLVVNPYQKDYDGDDLGDDCDPTPWGEDTDGDGFADPDDNCPSIPNPGQDDTDKDGIGDACDALTDSDGDGVADESDACPFTPLGTPVNAAGCPDGDGDGIADTSDNCPLLANADQLDSDRDGMGDVCDADPFKDKDKDQDKDPKPPKDK